MMDTPMRDGERTTEVFQDSRVWMILPLNEKGHLQNLLIKQCRMTMMQVEMSTRPNALMIPLMIPPTCWHSA